MKIVIFFSVLSLLFVGCLKKDPQNQPCTLKFETAYVQDNQSLVSFSSGLISLKKIEVEGDRQGASSIDIESEWTETHFIYYPNEAWGPDMDIPVGNYTNIEVDFRFRGDNYPSWRLIGMTNYNQNEIPFIFETYNDLEIELESTSIPELVKNSDYKFRLQLNTNQLLSQLDQNEIDNATVSQFNGNDAIVVSSSSNSTLYSKIMNQLYASLSFIITQ